MNSCGSVGVASWVAADRGIGPSASVSVSGILIVRSIRSLVSGFCGFVVIFAAFAGGTCMYCTSSEGTSGWCLGAQRSSCGCLSPDSTGLHVGAKLGSGPLSPGCCPATLPRFQAPSPEAGQHCSWQPTHHPQLFHPIPSTRPEDRIRSLVSRAETVTSMVSQSISLS